MEEFERRVVLDGARKGKLGREERIPVRDGRLVRTKFGRLMGMRIESRDICTIDYYGLIKKTDGFIEMVRETTKMFPGKQVKSIEAKMVHFGSIKIGDVVELAPDLASDFLLFKRDILNARGFDHSYGK